jgi:hypothetical protein
MKINEFSNQPDNSLNFNVVDDAAVYMRNDPVFYRKEFFPTMTKLADLHSAGKKFDHKKIMAPMIEKGINGYCKKYNIGKTPEDIFKQPDRDELLDKLFSEEINEIKKGEYK